MQTAPKKKASFIRSLTRNFLFLGQHRSPGIETDIISEEIDRNSITTGKRNYQRSARSVARLKTKRNASVVLACWTVSPFRWQKNRFKCAYCEEQFTECSTLREHVSMCSKNHSLDDIYSKFKEMSLINVDLTDATCRVCTVPLVSIDAMRAHVAQHGYRLDPQHPDGVIPFHLDNSCWKCVVCNEEFNNFLKLYEHMNVHYQHYICDICGKGYMTAQRLRKHSEAHAIGPFPCNDCDKIFNTRASRESHRATRHIKEPKYQCPKCEMRFDGYYDRMNHLNETHREREVVYNCPHCELKFKTSGKRSAHVRSIHFPPLRTHGCSYCDWNFKTAYELKRHIVKHTGERNYHCTMCDKSYPRNKTLKEHMRIHDHNGVFNCKWCSCEYKQKTKLLRHVRTNHSLAHSNDGKLMKPNAT
ncbi:Zinc finger and BTB domain-containing protein 17 [Eumeta japonica]|uniref:Zinc finger and BTB domain-containing protein 17 n=1 Tax=Eumeta variegata TaxID=151549 RepID=A0A4C1V3X2_EUMVA|nr:Zinc finger and BTB domain-containing protein 17 [Eumeta japonica]